MQYSRRRRCHCYQMQWIRHTEPTYWFDHWASERTNHPTIQPTNQYIWYKRQTTNSTLRNNVPSIKFWNGWDHLSSSNMPSSNAAIKNKSSNKEHQRVNWYQYRVDGSFGLVWNGTQATKCLLLDFHCSLLCLSLFVFLQKEHSMGYMRGACKRINAIRFRMFMFWFSFVLYWEYCT